MTWQPEQYLAFTDARLRPALDLMQRIDLHNPTRIADLGCGPGNVTALLAQRWPDAKVTGYDSSPEMIARARQDHPAMNWPNIEWQLADIAAWNPDHQFDLVFSNAALHWLDQHHELFPTLMQMVSPGGNLAIQMPDNANRASHRSIHDLATSPEWSDRLADQVRPWPVLSAEAYLKLFSDAGWQVDLWTTDYMQLLQGENAIAHWTKSTALRPFLSALDTPQEKNCFFGEYAKILKNKYSEVSSNIWPYPFKRLFIIARPPSIG